MLAKTLYEVEVSWQLSQGGQGNDFVFSRLGVYADAVDADTALAARLSDPKEPKVLASRIVEISRTILAEQMYTTPREKAKVR